VIVPTPPQGFTFNTVPCGNGGTQNTPTPITINVTDLSTGCSTAFTNGFQLSPADPSCMNEQQTPPPTANFTFFVVDATTHTMQFQDTSSGNPTSWNWDFTNNGSFDSTVQNPQFSYPAAGTYAVRLKVANAGGSNSGSEIVKMVTVP